MRNCPGCNSPMIDGQMFDGLLKCHWECRDIVRNNMGDQNADDLIQLRINERLRSEGILEGSHLWKVCGGK